MNFQQRNQTSFEYHAVDNLEVRVENRNAGCWSSSSVKLIQLCCIGTIFPIIWILVPVYAKLLSFSSSALPLAFTRMYMLDSGFSTLWCKGHHLHTNFTFDAYLVEEEPALLFEAQNWTQHFELNDDLKEHWGSYLLKGSEIEVRSCASHLGASVMLIKANVSSMKSFTCLKDGSSEEKPDKNPQPTHDTILPFPSNSSQKLTAHNESLNEANSTLLDDEEESKAALHLQEVDETENGAFEDFGENGSNSPVETDTSLSEESLTSSSEEEFLSCANLILTKPVFPDQNCSDASKSKHVLIRYTVEEEGYYFVVFSSSFEQKGQENNPVSAQFDLIKPVFNTTNAVASCHNTTECAFALCFASTHRIIVALPNARQSISTDDNSTYSVDSECVPRTPIYLAFGLTLPLVLILCAFL